MDFKGYEKIEDMLGYEGFISSDGRFYRWRSFAKQNEITYENWIYEFLNCYDPELDLNNFDLHDFTHPYKLAFLPVVEDVNLHNVRGVYNSLNDYNAKQMQLLFNLQDAYKKLNKDTSLFDFNKYGVQEMLDYVGFITLNGKFFRVRKTGDIFIPNHIEWSYAYCKTHNVIIPDEFKRFDTSYSSFTAFEYLISSRGLNFLAFCEDMDNESLIPIVFQNHNSTKIQNESLKKLNKLLEKNTKNL